MCVYMHKDAPVLIFNRVTFSHNILHVVVYVHIHVSSLPVKVASDSEKNCVCVFY